MHMFQLQAISIYADIYKPSFGLLFISYACGGLPIFIDIIQALGKGALPIQAITRELKRPQRDLPYPELSVVFQIWLMQKKICISRQCNMFTIKSTMQCNCLAKYDAKAPKNSVKVGMYTSSKIELFKPK